MNVYTYALHLYEPIKLCICASVYVSNSGEMHALMYG